MQFAMAEVKMSRAKVISKRKKPWGMANASPNTWGILANILFVAVFNCRAREVYSFSPLHATTCSSLCASRRDLSNVMGVRTQLRSMHDPQNSELVDIHLGDDIDCHSDFVDIDPEESIRSSRRAFVSSSLKFFVSVPVLLHEQSAPSNAYYEKAYPIELKATDATGNDYQTQKVKQIINTEQRQAAQNRPLTSNKLLGSTLWGGALWLLSGSRSNPVATPLANILYKKDNEKWLQDRNEGWFAALPWEFLVILAIVYVIFGFGFDSLLVAITSVSDGALSSDSLSFLSSTTTLSLQLASVTLIAGGSLELGRIASGEKKQTKQEGARDQLLQEEFEVFAEKRLLSIRNGPNVHRNEVVAAFRRFYAKYRSRPEQQQPADDNNVTDLEIERALREWARGKAGIDTTSAGFYSGIQINRDADAFVNR